MVYPSFLAPIDEYTNLPFRLLCQKHGAKATCVPLVNSTALSRKPEKLNEVDVHPDEKNVGVQLVGNNPNDIGKSCRRIAESIPQVKWFNLNCGCPSARTRESGGGSALLDRPQIILDSLAEMGKYHGNISVKMRLKPSLEETVELCRNIQKAGVGFIIIHGRTVKQGYSGKCSWDGIRTVKEALDIPIIGNGDLKTSEEGRMRVEEGYCDSFMIGRAAMDNPMVFSDKLPDLKGRKLLFQEYMNLCNKYHGKIELGELRLKAINFMTGVPNASMLRNQICRAQTLEEIIDRINKIEN